MPRTTEYHWVFGKGSHLHFNNASDPVQASPTAIQTGEGCASISDNNGNLLFYTDGVSLWDSSNTLKISSMGGHASSTHSAIIVPPAGGGSLYHVMTTPFYDKTKSYSPVHHWLVDANGNDQGTGPYQLDAMESSERLAATTHEECDLYWAISIDYEANRFYSHLITNDSRPSNPPVTSLADGAIDKKLFDPRGQMKFSPDGRYLAIAYPHNPKERNRLANATPRVSLYRFNKTNGTLTRLGYIEEMERPWGIEFSPDSQILYFTHFEPSQGSTRIYSIQCANLNANINMSNSFLNLVDRQNVSGKHDIYGAMQLGPNNKIYVTAYNRPYFSEIANPNNFLAPAFDQQMRDPNGKPIEFKEASASSIPTFTRIADECLIKRPPKGDCCKGAIEKVNDELAGEASDDPNPLKPCKGGAAVDGPIGHPRVCKDLELPKIEPHVSISWGASKCECLESDDVEIMHITICNPYANITMSNMVIPRLEVKMKNGQPVPTLPDGTPSVRIIPRGPICFGDIGPCQCVTREFVMENRGALSGAANPYEIEIEEFCFGVSFCNQASACFEFIICKDN